MPKDSPGRSEHPLSKVACSLGVELQAALRYLEHQRSFVSRGSAQELESKLLSRLGAQKPNRGGVKVALAHRTLQVFLRKHASITARVSVLTSTQSRFVVEADGTDLLCLVLVEKAFCTGPSVDESTWEENVWRRVISRRRSYDALLWSGATIPLERAGLDWRSFCCAHVFATKRVGRSRTRHQPKLAQQVPAADAKPTATAAPRYSPHELREGIELVVGIIRCVVHAWNVDLDDPTGSRRRFALIELD